MIFQILPEVAKVVLEKLVHLQIHCIEVESSDRLDSTFDSMMHYSESESENSMEDFHPGDDTMQMIELPLEAFIQSIIIISFSLL